MEMVVRLFLVWSAVLLIKVHAQEMFTEDDVRSILASCNNPGDPYDRFGLSSKIVGCTVHGSRYRNILSKKHTYSLSEVSQSLGGLSSMFKANMSRLHRQEGAVNDWVRDQTPQEPPVRTLPTPESQRMTIVPRQVDRPDQFSPQQWQWLQDMRFLQFSQTCLRLEYRQMSPERRNRYHQALNTLNQDWTLSPYNISKMELLSSIHFNRLTEGGGHPGAHRGGAFWPWHRQFLLVVENAVRFIDSTVCLPYWDPSPEGALGVESAIESQFWTADFVGEGFGYVQTGPFAFWNFTVELPSNMTEFIGFSGNRLNREVYKDTLVQLGARFWNATTTELFLNRSAYRDISWCTDMTGEQFHNLNHLAVGGFLLDGEFSAVDPLFFAWHAFVDSMWEEWRQTRQWDTENPYTSYSSECDPVVPNEGDPPLPDFHAPNMLMEPFEMTVLEGVRDISHLYSYSPRPQCTAATPVCLSYRGLYFFCDTSTYNCVAKKAVGGTCVQNVQCTSSQCISGQCAFNWMEFLRAERENGLSTDFREGGGVSNGINSGAGRAVNTGSRNSFSHIGRSSVRNDGGPSFNTGGSSAFSSGVGTNFNSGAGRTANTGTRSLNSFNRGRSSVNNDGGPASNSGGSTGSSFSGVSSGANIPNRGAGSACAGGGSGCIGYKTGGWTTSSGIAGLSGIGDGDEFIGGQFIGDQFIDSRTLISLCGKTQLL